MNAYVDLIQQIDQTIISFHPGQFTTGLDALLFFGLILTPVVA